MTLSLASASASYEQVGTFAGKPGKPAEAGVFPEEVQLGGVSGIAINSTGAGGVPAGTIYAVTMGSGEYDKVARYNPDGSFSEAWTVRPNGSEYERCGPEGEPSNPTCPTRSSGGSSIGLDIEVDQITGYVYVVNQNYDTNPSSNDLVKIYSADGSKFIASFGEIAIGQEQQEPTSAHPSKIFSPFGIAVADDGTVYVADFNHSSNQHRVMVWKPETPGDYEHYVYTGEANDIVSGGLGEPGVRGLVLDDAGNLYGNQEEVVLEYDPATNKQICRFNQPDGGITSMTVDPHNGEVFYFDYKNKKIHTLAPCNGKGEFVETGTIALSPVRKAVEALAFDPSRSYSAGRSAGVLFAGSPQSELFSGEGALGYIFAPPQELSPLVSEEAVSSVSAGSALFKGKVNPNSSKTRYTFQYISDAAYQANPTGEGFAGAAEAPAGGALIEGTEALAVSAAVAGLDADTTYRYRLVATSNCSVSQPAKVCETVGTEKEVRTFPIEGPGLTDHRAYEFVSPANKQGGEVVPATTSASCSGECKPGGLGFTSGPMQSAPDGDSIVYAGTPFSHTQGGLQENEYYAKRGSGGWQTTILSPDAQTRAEGRGYKAFNRELTAGILYLTGAQVGGAPGGYPNVYAQPTASAGVFDPLLGFAPPNRTEGAANNSLSIGFGGASADFSRIFFAANDALTGPTAFAPAAVDGGSTASNLYERSGGELRLVNVEPGNSEATPGATFGGSKEADASRVVSADGSRVFWSAAGKTYVRVNAEFTREISDAGATYLTASLDGSKVLMSDGKIFGQLATAVPSEEADLSAGKGGFEGIVGQSEDLSRIYFVDSAVLDDTAGAQGKVAEAGKYNLYAWQGGAARFIAQLNSNDGSPSGGSDWAASPTKRSAEASPGGRWLAFASKRQLTGYDNVGPCFNNFGKIEPDPCEEIYLYDAATDTVKCPSCNRSNQSPLSNGSVLRLINGETVEQPRYLSDSGRLYFDSRESLVPADTNNGVEDVYGFEPDGVGTCTHADGCISLISAGTSLVDSNLVSVDESGKNVFFTSRDRLVPSDSDDLMDLYDAREGGGFAAESETARSECQGEACQPIPVAPNDPTPGSSTFNGAGNLNEAKAKKHSKKSKKKHHKRQHKIKQAKKNKRGGSK
jgi:hypothetical protein